MEYEFIYKQDYGLSYIQENIEMVVYSIICFAVPFFMGHPQLMVGIIVNTALVLGALNLKSYKMLPVIILPSIAVMSRGMIFGPFTVFLLYMIPFIWIGNSLLVYAMKEFGLRRKMNKFLSLGIGTAFKASFLFVSALVLVKLSVVPAALLGAMGLMQVYTAIAGGVIALGIHEGKKRINLSQEIF